MASMNWLGFSLSAQELPPPSNPHHHHSHHDQSRLGYSSDEISGGNDVSGGECFDLTSDSTGAPSSLNLPPPFGILEAFNRNNHHAQGLLSNSFVLLIFQANLTFSHTHSHTHNLIT